MLQYRALSWIGLLFFVLALPGGWAGADALYEWRADYRLLLNGNDYYGEGIDFVIIDAAISADGSMAAIGGYNSSTYYWAIHILPTDGGAGTVVALPLDDHPDRDTMRLNTLCIDADGSRVFFVTPWYQYRIFKIEGGAAVEILNFSNYAALSMSTNERVRTTNDGSWVYFNEDRDDLFRVSHLGGDPELVLDDASIIRENGYAGWAIGDFDISADGNEAVFVLIGYRDGKKKATVVKYDAFSLVNSTVHQLTNDSPSSYTENYPTISADGSTVAFSGAGGWTTAQSDGAGILVLESESYNVSGCNLSANGASMVYSDADADRGRIVSTDGSGHLDIFPQASPVYIGAYHHFEISDSAAVVGFGYTTRIYYAGRLGVIDPAFPGPAISNIALDPPFMSLDNPTGATLTMHVSHPGGLAEIDAVGSDSMLDGNNTAGFVDLMLSFPFSPNDLGSGSDATAGDGIYTAWADAGGAAGALSWQRIRTSAEDQTGHVTVTDVWYPACPAAGCWLLIADFEEGDFAEWSAVVGG